MQTSIIFWLGVMMFYAALFGPLIPKIVNWPLWVQITVGVVALALPVAGQIILIYKNRQK